MSLLGEVVAMLVAEKIPHALIGAAAMAVHGVSRATADVDLLTLDVRVLRPELWRDVEARGAILRVMRGDSEDPLAGSVRVSRTDDRTVDIVVGRYAWQREIIENAEELSIGDVTVKVARPAGLVLLKLHAGGPRDAWDIRSLLESHEDAEGLRADVDDGVSALSSDERRL